MSIGILVFLVFVAVTAGVVGLAMLLSGRTQVKREKAIQNRLQEVSGGAAMTGEDGSPADSTLLRKETVSALPNVERIASAALKGSSVERWLQQTGSTASISFVILVTLVFGALASIATFMFTHLLWAAVLAFILGLGIQPMLLKHKRNKRIDKFEEHFPEALDLLSR